MWNVKMVKTMKNMKMLGVAILVVILASISLCIVMGPNDIFATVHDNLYQSPARSSDSESGQIAGGWSQNITLNTSMPNAVGKILVYKTNPPIITNETTIELARKFNITGELRWYNVFQSKDNRYSLGILPKSGRIAYQDQDRPNDELDYPANLPTDAEAEQIAIKFLKARDLYPEGAVLVSPPHHQNAYLVGAEKETITHTEMCVWFHRVLNGLPVEGTQMYVGVGGKGDVIEYFANWRNYTPYKEYPLISPEEAFNQLKNQGVRVSISDQPKQVSINDVYLAYDTSAAAHNETYLQPVWAFEGQVLVNGSSVMPVFETIPALKEVPTELITS
jgi:hypothetical protein